MRNKLAGRREGITMAVAHVNSTGNEERYLLTFNLDTEDNIREVFCADRRVGTDIHGILTDLCILISIHLQTGAEPERLLRSMTEVRGEGQTSGPPGSPAGTIIRAIIKLQQELNALPAGQPLASHEP